MAGLPYVITEACIDVKDRACVDVCPVQCIYELEEPSLVLRSEYEAGAGEVGHRAPQAVGHGTRHPVAPDPGGHPGRGVQEVAACARELALRTVAPARRPGDGRGVS